MHISPPLGLRRPERPYQVHLTNTPLSPQPKQNLSTQYQNTSTFVDEIIPSVPCIARQK